MNSERAEDMSFPLFVPGEIVALLTPLQELEPGLYVVDGITDGWATLSLVLDDEIAEEVIVTDRRAHIPVKLFPLLMPVGLNLSAPA